MTGTAKSADYSRRLTPPPYLAKGEATVFRSIVASVGSDHFAKCDLPLLVEFARASCLANLAAEKIGELGAVIDGKASAWIVVQEKSQRALVAISARLRLCPQSRFDRTKAGTSSRTGIPDFSDFDDDDGLLALPEGARRKKPKRGLASYL